jgi:hypothetical protein
MERPPGYVLEQLRKAARLKNVQLEELYHVTTFCAERVRDDGPPQILTIRVLDAGDRAPAAQRYVCEVRSDDGRAFATGNPGGTVDDAIALVNWASLNHKD